MQPLRLLSSVYGRIEQVLLVRAGFDNAASDVSLRDIISSYESHGIEVLELEKDPPSSRANASSDSEITVEHRLVSEMLQKGLRAVLKAEIDLSLWQREFEVIAELGLPLVHSEWAQDGFCVMEYDRHAQVLLQSLSSRRFLDQFVSFELALKRHLGMFLVPTLTEWEGGNVLVGDHFALVGKNTLATNWRNALLKLSDADRGDATLVAHRFEQMKEEMQAQLGYSELIWVGFPSVRRDLMNPKQFCYQPLFHIDLFLTLGGKDGSGADVIYIGDPGLGWKLLRSAGFGELIRPAGLIWDGEALTEQMIEHSINRDMRDFFEDYNRTSLRRKFRVVSLPMLIEDGVVYSWNNSLVEFTEESSRAFLPNYIMADAGSRALARSEVETNRKMEVLQHAVQEIMHLNGIKEIIWTGHGLFMQHYSRRKGSLHCLTKVLRRQPYRFGSCS